MATNTIYAPQNINEFEKSKLQFSGQSMYFECGANATADGDLLLTDDCLLTGGMLLVKGGEFHDQLYLQIVHPTLGVVNEFVSGFRVVEDSIKQFELQLNYPAKLSAGLTIRCHYVSSSSVGTRDIALNLFLHKVLV